MASGVSVPSKQTKGRAGDMEEEVGLPPVREDVRAYMAESRSRNKAAEKFSLNRRAKWSRIGGPNPVTGNPIHAGISFSKATYIGNSSLSRLLRAAWLWRQDTHLPEEALSDVVVMGVSFSWDWPEKQVMEYEMGAAVFELLKTLERIQHQSHRVDSKAIEESLADLLIVVQALEGFTTVLINGLNHPILMGRHRVWKTFELSVLKPLHAFAEAAEVRAGQSSSSPAVTSLLWLEWGVVSWLFLNESAGREEECLGDCEMGTVCSSLLGRLFKADDASFFDAVGMLRDGRQGPKDSIKGSDVVEVWICLIHTLNQAAQHHQSRGFWTYFNSQVGRSWAEEEESAMEVVGDATSGETRSVRGRRFLDMMLELCALHQFGVDGSSHASITVPENWVLVYWLLEHKLLDLALSETEEMELQCRHVTVFCHRLLLVWKWGPGEYPVASISKYLRLRHYRDMPSEGGHRFPDFLKKMIDTSIADLEQDYNIPKDDDVEPQPHYYVPAGQIATVPRIPRLSVDLSLAETVSCTDSAFEIFLKLVILTFHQLVGLLSQEPKVFVGPRPLTMVPRMDDPKNPQLETVTLLNKVEKYKSCKRLASKILCSSSDLLLERTSDLDRSSSVCNSCNVVLVIALMVPDCVRNVSVRDVEGILDPNVPDDNLLEIIIHTHYYLGTIWQRQAALGKLAIWNHRHVEFILNVYNEHLVELRPRLEKESPPPEEPTSRNRITFRPQRPATNLAGLILGLMTRLLKSGGRLAPEGTSYPKVAFLDKRLAVFFAPTAKFDTELRLSALELIEGFLEQRNAHKVRLEKTPAPKAVVVQAMVSGMSVDGQVDVKSAAFAEDEDLTWAEEFAFDDDFLASSLAEPELSQPKPAEVVLQEDDGLMKVLMEWVYPVLATLIKERRQAHVREHVRKAFVAKNGGSASSRTVVVNPYLKQSTKTPSQAAREGTDKELQPSPPSTVLSLAPHSFQYLRDIFADVSMLLLDKKVLKMIELDKEFRVGIWDMPVLQRLVLDDKLSWATRVAATNPSMLLTQEDSVLLAWFASIGVPLNEVRLQVQLSDIIVKHGLAVRGTVIDIKTPLDTMTLAGHIFDGVPWFPCAFPNLSIESNQEPFDIDAFLAQVVQERERVEELRSVRFQLVAKAVSNMGEHYAELQPLLDRPYCRLHSVIQEIRFRYRGYLLAICSSLEMDYKRLQTDTPGDLIIHAEFLCDIFTHILKNCEKILQDDKHFHDSTIFLESVRLDAIRKKSKTSGNTATEADAVAM
ncbi:hypothetical protein BGZ95_003873, partial [Linnemannia exigua]